MNANDKNIEEVSENQSEKREKIKKPKKISRAIGFVKRKTAPAREFMKSGRTAAMIAETVLGTFFIVWMLEGYTYGRVPAGLCFLVGAALIAAASEILNLVLKLVFGAGKRCKSYFFIVAFVVSFSAIGANQMSEFFFAYGCCFLLTLAVDIVARIICGFIRTKRFKQAFAYILGAFSVAYIGVFAFFFFSDSFGKSRIDFYNQIEKTNVAQAEGFGEFLKNGQYEVATLSYGPETDADIVTETLDYSIFDSVQDRSGFNAFMVDTFSDYDLKKVPVKGQIWYPAGQTNCPVFFMVHGNHDSTVPSYLGYDYIGEYLASNGFVVISVDENIINCTEEGNDKRAILLLDNMKEMFRQNNLSDGPLYGLLDEEKVVIGGHSRGGEIVATAYLFNDLDKYPEDGNISFDYHFNITSIVAIAPCVDQYRPVNQSVEISDVNYLIIHGANDQDVSDMMGEKQYNNISFSNDNERETTLLHELGKSLPEKEYDRNIKKHFGKYLAYLSNYYYDLIRDLSRGSNLHVYEINAHSDAGYVFHNKDKKSLYQLYKEIEQSKKELLYYIMLKGKELIPNTLSDHYSALDFDIAYVPHYILTLISDCDSVSDLYDYVDCEYDDMAENDKRAWEERFDAIQNIDKIVATSEEMNV